ncbi:hypothetical protein V5F49_05010 [Xanthobacter sp. V3C-3]|uniref:hypothetical protein n=1 Tax=Xanthobacter lutulentifluminis TaxID=3119935 RepID=UPI003727212A
MADFAGGNIDKGAVAFAAGRVHAAMAALVSARRPGTIKVRASHPEQTMEWTPDERAAVEGLRRLQAAGKAGDPNRWLKTWMELPPRAVELVVAEAGGYAAFALAPWLIAARPFGLPGPEGIAPLLPQAIARASAKGRPPEALRDMAAIAVLHAAAAVLGNPDEPPTGWSNPKSEFRSLLARIEHAYAGIPPEEDPARLPAEERRGLKAAGMAKPSPARSALNLGSAATLTRLVAAAFPTRTA